MKNPNPITHYNHCLKSVEDPRDFENTSGGSCGERPDLPKISPDDLMVTLGLDILDSMSSSGGLDDLIVLLELNIPRLLFGNYP